MRPVDNTEQIIKENLSFTASATMHDRILNDVLAAQEQAKKTKSGLAQANLWRTVMKSPLSKLATAAIVALACLIGLSLWRGTESGIALADVLTQIEQIGAYMYQVSISTTTQIAADKSIEQYMQGSILVSQEYGSRMTMNSEMLDPNYTVNISEETYVLPQKKTAITINHKQKKYTQEEINDTIIERMKKQNNDPRMMVEQILKYDYKYLGRSSIDGIEVEVFQTTDPNYQGGAFDRVDVRLWVDVKTSLPVLMEKDLQKGDLHVIVILNDFLWNVSVDASDFEPVIPEGYTTDPGVNEETAIQGLKLFGDLSGRYPEELDYATLMSKATGELTYSNTPFAKQLKEERKELGEEEKAKKFMDIMMPISGLGTFYASLVQEKKDPAYYGKTVTPKDADKVLMRWKVSDNEYRVIYGDLRAETVTPQKLAELEAALPK